MITPQTQHAVKTIELNQFQKLLPQLDDNLKTFYLIVKNKQPLFHLIPAISQQKQLQQFKKELELTNLYTTDFINHLIQSEKDILNNNLTMVNSLKKLTT